MIQSLNLEGRGRPGRVASLFYDREANLFRGIMETETANLRATMSVELPPGQEAARIMAASIQGWLAPSEAALLFELAQGCTGAGCIVEIGSYAGKSTVCLAWGSKLGAGATIYAVDPHIGSQEHQAQRQGGTSTLPSLRGNLDRAGVADLVEICPITSTEAALVLDGPVEMAFIDGDHQRAGRDWDMWYPKLIPNGILAIHDSVGGGWPQVERDVQDRVQRHRLDGTVRVVGTVTVVRK